MAKLPSDIGATFLQRSSVVKALQLTKDNWEEACLFVAVRPEIPFQSAKVLTTYLHESGWPSATEVVPGLRGFEIQTEGGFTVVVVPGDWIIKRPSGSFSVLLNSDFINAYREVPAEWTLPREDLVDLLDLCVEAGEDFWNLAFDCTPGSDDEQTWTRLNRELFTAVRNIGGIIGYKRKEDRDGKVSITTSPG